MKSQRLMLALACVALSPLLAACGSSSSSSSSKSTGSKTPIVVGLSNSSVDSVWRPKMLKDFQAEATNLKNEGLIKSFMVQSANGTAPVQAQQIQGMVNQGANLILIDAASATALNGLISQITARGVTVVTFDNPVTSDKSTNLYQNEHIISYETAMDIAKLAGGKGTIVEMNGTAGAPLSDAREKLANEAFAKFPKVKVIKAYADWNGAEAKQQMATILANNPNIAGVWTQGSMDLGIASAFEDAGKQLPPIEADGLGGFLTLWNKLKLQRGYQTVGIVVSPMIVDDALWAGVKLRQGWKMKGTNMILSHGLITNANLGQYLKLNTPPGEHVDVPIVTEAELYKEYMTEG